MTVEDKLTKRTTLANIAAFGIVAAGLAYFIVSRDTDSVKWLVAFAAGWLFKEVRK